MSTRKIVPEPIDDCHTLDLDGPSEADRRWFERHPDRSHRIRRALNRELPARCAGHTHVVVRQITPGYRLRASVGLLKPSRTALRDEAFAHALFDEVWGLTFSDGGVFSLADVARKADSLREAMAVIQ
jgi:hypothetical protein